MLNSLIYRLKRTVDVSAGQISLVKSGRVESRAQSFQPRKLYVSEKRTATSSSRTVFWFSLLCQVLGIREMPGLRMEMPEIKEDDPGACHHLSPCSLATGGN
jgi:hypothetical protein